MDISLSVILPVYNGESYLRDSLLRCFREGISDLEVIVVDDGSTDKTSACVADLPVRYLCLEANRGQAAAQNFGLRHARGRYVAFLDCDDILVPWGLRWRLEWLQKHPTERVIAGEMAGVVDENAKLLGSYRSVLNPRYRTAPERITRAYLEEGNEFPSQMWLLLFERSLLEEVGPFDESFRCAHDNDYFYRVLEKTSIAHENRPIAFYRLHGKNLSGSWRKTQFERNRMALAEDLFAHLKHGIQPK